MFDLIWRLVATGAVVIIVAIAVYATSWPIAVCLLVYALGVVTIWRIYLGYFARRR